MQIEIEVKFLDVDFAAVRASLQNAGAVCEVPMRQMRRVIIDFPDRRLQTKEDAFVRVRDEGNRVTVTYKKHTAMELGGAHEIEFVVDSFEQARSLFEALGMIVESDQETRRETWKIDDCEVVLDEWPWLKPYIEIEGPSEESLKRSASRLGFDWNDAVFGSVMQAYRQEYGGIGLNETVGDIPIIRFQDPVPEWLESRRHIKKAPAA